MKTLLKTFLILALFATEVKSQTTLTIRQVYDYNINDQFHYQTNSGPVPPSATRFTIVDKHFSPLNDTVTYVRLFDNYYTLAGGPSPHLVYTFSSFTDTISYTNLDSLVFKTWIITDSSSTSFSDSSYISSYWCGIQISEYSGCSGCDSEGHYYHKQYGQGVGIVKDDNYWNNFPEVRTRFDLVYYKKGAITCGTPDLTTVAIDESTKEAASFFIYPNPVESIVTLHNTSPQDHFQCTLYNPLGQNIMTMDLTGESNKIDLNHLKSGIYYLSIKTDHKTSIVKLVKK